MWVRGAYKIGKKVVTGSQQQAAVEKKRWCFWNEYTIQNEYQLADIPRILLKRVESSTAVTELPGGTVYYKYGCSTMYDKFELHLRNMKGPPLTSWSRRKRRHIHLLAAIPVLVHAVHPCPCCWSYEMRVFRTTGMSPLLVCFPGSLVAEGLGSWTARDLAHCTNRG